MRWPGATAANEILLVDEPRALAAFLADAAPAPALALALETRVERAPDGEETERLVGVGIAVSLARAYLLPLERALLREGLHPRMLQARLLRVLGDPHTAKVAHDLKRLLRVLGVAGWPLGGALVDTALAADLLQPTWGAAGRSARAVLARLGDEREDLGASQAGHGMTSAQEALACARLDARLAPEVAAAGLGRVLEHVEMPLVPVLSDMERRGLFVETWSLAEAPPCAHARSLLALVDERTGRAHPRFAQLGGGSGRLAATSLDLAQLAARSDAGRELRRSVRAMRPGHVLIAADLAQLELRLAAHFAAEPTLVAAFRQEIDAHALAAAALFGASLRGVTSAQRACARLVAQAALRGEPAIVAPPSSRALRTLVARYLGLFPRLARWLGGAGDDLASVRDGAGFTRSLLGRRVVRNAAAGSAADVVKLAMTRAARDLAAAGCATHLVLQARDELLFEAPEVELPVASRIIAAAVAEAAAEHASLVVPVTARLGVGASWLEAHLLC
jgi:DNA polymerase I-like protein with 3'-5' exonuclease and polymerase domains